MLNSGHASGGEIAKFPGDSNANPSRGVSRLVLDKSSHTCIARSSSCDKCVHVYQGMWATLPETLVLAVDSAGAKDTLTLGEEIQALSCLVHTNIVHFLGVEERFILLEHYEVCELCERC